MCLEIKVVTIVTIDSAFFAPFWGEDSGCGRGKSELVGEGGWAV